MKEALTYNRAVQTLTKYFKLVNHDLFSDELPMPAITVQTSVGAYGHLSCMPVWHNENGVSQYELNIGAETLSRPVENVIATLVHEACHLYNVTHGIKDTSNNCVYHNKKFKACAEAHMLHIDHHDTYGWTITSPTEDLINWIISQGLEDIKINRGLTLAGFGGLPTGDDGSTPTGAPAITKTGAPKKASNSIKWICPECGAIVRSTKVLNIVCGDCNVPFIQA